MGIVLEEQGSLEHYTNGLDLHFDYNRNPQQGNSAKRKKKKKKKKQATQSELTSLSEAAKSASAIPLSAVDLNDPDADYPENRVIKVGANGDLIVESIMEAEDDDLEYNENSSHNGTISLFRDAETKSMLPAPFMEFLKRPGDLERSIFQFKNEEEQRFWNDMSDKARKKILDIDSDMIMDRFNLNRKHSLGKFEHNNKSSAGCSCSSCGLNMDLIRDEMENKYLPHLKDFLTSDWYLNSPELYRSKGYSPDSPDVLVRKTPLEEPKEVVPTSASKYSKAGPRKQTVAKKIFESVPKSKVNTSDQHMQGRITTMDLQFQELVDKMNMLYKSSTETTMKNSSSLNTHELIDSLYKFTKEGKEGLPKAIEYLKMYTSEQKSGPQIGNMAESMSMFADMLLKDDGQNFINMVEYIKKDQGKEANYSMLFNNESCSFEGGYKLSHERNDTNEVIEDSEMNLSPELLADNCDRDHTCWKTDHDNCSSRSYSEESEGEFEEDEEDDGMPHGQEQLQELHGLFMLEVFQMIRSRFRDVFDKKVSEDRTKKFIEELEAEENAQKERELRKQRQKEEQKEKKRLQQIAKEEERQKRLEVERQKAAAVKLQQEAVRAEQIRRKEEARLKKLQEKERKIEALRKKEEQKKLQKELSEKKLETKNNAPQNGANVDSEVPEHSDPSQLPSSKETSLSAFTAPHQDPKRSPNEMPALSSDQSQSKTVLPTITEPDVSVSTSPASIPSSFQSTIAPSTNHLLEQLYHPQPPMAQPSIPFPPVDDFSDLLRQSTLSHLHQQQQALAPSNSVPDLWASPSGLLLFDSNNGSLWGSSFGVNSSIWGTSGASLSWNTAPQVTSSAPHIPPSLAPNYVPQQLIPRQPSLSTMNPNTNLSQSTTNEFGFSESSREAIQVAAIEAFHIMSQNNQLQFGAAPARKLFQLAKDISSNVSLSFPEFLRLLNSSSKVTFDLVYDDFGSVTHITLSQQGMNGFKPDANSSAMMKGANFNQNAPAYNSIESLSSANTFQAPDFGYKYSNEGSGNNRLMW